MTMSRDFTNFQFPQDYSKTSPNIFITFKKTWLITAFQLYIASNMVREKAKFNLHKLKLTQQQKNHYMKWFSLWSEFSNLKNKIKNKKEKKRKERERERLTAGGWRRWEWRACEFRSPSHGCGDRGGHRARVLRWWLWVPSLRLLLSIGKIALKK